MALLLDDIEWGQPIFPEVSDPAWESEVKRRVGRTSQVDRRVAPNPWMRRLCLDITAMRVHFIPQRLLNIGAMVTAQENSCRYCYGANRAYMKILGYSESFIGKIERDMHVAELNDKERAFVAFCRNLARSRPRPAKAEKDALIALGFTSAEINEMALAIAAGCFFNRMGILTASPPELAFERMANGFVGRVLALAGPLMRMLAEKKASGRDEAAGDAATLAAGPFGTIVAALAGLPSATMLRTALDGAFASTVLSRSAKALMFAVVARTLECRRSDLEARKILVAEGFDAYEIDSALASLASPRLSAVESRMLSWARNTVYYKTAPIQAEARALVAEVGEAVALEAVGVASLANAVVRLAMLVE